MKTALLAAALAISPIVATAPAAAQSIGFSIQVGNERQYRQYPYSYYRYDRRNQCRRGDVRVYAPRAHRYVCVDRQRYYGWQNRYQRGDIGIEYREDNRRDRYRKF